MENGDIVNDQITASPPVIATFEAWKGRLYSDSWWSAPFNPGPTLWIQVAFSSAVSITAIQTQGSDNSSWVTKLQIQTGNAVDKLLYIMNESGPEVSDSNHELSRY